MASKVKVRRDDQVKVISGKDRGKTGRVVKVDREKQRVYVEGLNIIKRHQRANPANPNAQVGVIEREAAIHVSNVAIVDPKDKKPTRLRMERREQDGRHIRMRVTKRSGSELD